MSDEYLDIVDEENNLVGKKKLRSEVHKTGLRHRTVHIYYVNFKDGNYYFLVHLRSKFKDLNPNKWDTRFGGHVQSGEKIEEALVSELEEEIGLELNPGDFTIGPIRKKDKYPNNEFVYSFYYQADDDLSKLVFRDNEVQRVKWMFAEDITTSLKNNPENWSSSQDGFKNIYNFLKNKSVL